MDLIDEILKGDPRCTITMGSRVKKIVADKEPLPIGSEGTVVGSMKMKMFVTEYGLIDEIYAVEYDGEEGAIRITSDVKIEKI